VPGTTAIKAQGRLSRVCMGWKEAQAHVRRPRCSAGMRSHCSLRPVAMGRGPTLMTVLPPYTSALLGTIGL
jgi:hypothetical protein